MYKNTSAPVSETGITTDQIRDNLITGMGFTKTNADAEIAKLEKLGNNIVLLEAPSSKLWIYAERE